MLSNILVDLDTRETRYLDDILMISIQYDNYDDFFDDLFTSGEITSNKNADLDP